MSHRYGSISTGMSRKYPRTPHLPWSPGATSDDVRVQDLSHFIDRDVVVTEKMDGENTTIWAGGSHARSLSSGPHPSRSYVRALAAQISPELPDGFRIVGENVAAAHSIRYDNLPAPFLAFGVHEGDRALSWDDSVEYFKMFGLKVVPLLYRGVWDEHEVRACWTGRSQYGGDQEGYVVRIADGFPLSKFAESVAKYVRAGHVQTDEHWMNKPVEWNRFRS